MDCPVEELDGQERSEGPFEAAVEYPIGGPLVQAIKEVLEPYDLAEGLRAAEAIMADPGAHRSNERTGR